MWYLIAFAAGVVAGFIIGVLIGRKNPKEADKLAELAKKAGDKLT